MPDKIIYTVGYSGFSIENFVAILKKYEISCLIDVRSIPKSNYYVDYNIERISKIMNQNKIIYRNYKKEFGAQQTEIKYFTDNVLDFVKFAKSPQFLNGIQKIESGTDLGYKFVLMCAEKRPEICHRNIMVARQFYKRGFEVRNILEDGSYVKQDEVEKNLLEKYFPNRNQLSLFEMQNEKEMIEESYRRRNIEIGYHTDDEGFDE